MAFPNTVYGKPGWEKQLTSDQRHKLGTRMAFVDGRVYRYAAVGGTGIASGRLITPVAATAAHDMDLAWSAGAAVGGTTITTGTSLTVTKDLYKDGWLYTNDGTGEGQVYPIKSNTAVSGAIGCVFTIDEEDGFVIALTATSSLFGVMPNQYSEIIVQPASGIAAAAAGVSPTTMTADYYGWVQTWGACALLNTGTSWVLGDQLASAETGAAGAAILLDSSGAPDNQSIGYCLGPSPADADFGFMMLTIAP
jgi:hypothetical protein